MFSDSICLGLIEILNKTAALVISAVFNTREHLDSERVFENKSFQAFK